VEQPKGALSPSGAVAHRRFFFWFKTSDELKVVLYLSYYAGREFFADSSRFSAAERIRPDQALRLLASLLALLLPGFFVFSFSRSTST